MRNRILLCCVFLGFSMSGLPAAAQSGSQAAGQTAAAMAADAQPGFLVATIKPSAPSESGWSFESEANRINCKNAALVEILQLAYEIHPRQLVGAPEWVTRDRYDISGVPDAPGIPNLAQERSMYRQLLADRFQLKLHREVRSLPIYTITTANGEPKLKPADSGEVPNTGSRSHGTQRTLIFRNMSMADLALNLNFYEDRPVIDNTSLPGRYDFTLSWTFDTAQASDNDAPPALFTAIKEQLGLKVEGVKGPAPVLVIDSVERPSPN